ncbi:MAG: hypothetical protein ACTSUD_00670 [Alphaproteobacteria bacterium]
MKLSAVSMAKDWALRTSPRSRPWTRARPLSQGLDRRARSRIQMAATVSRLRRKRILAASGPWA